GGTGQTEQQVQAMAALKPAGYVGTPSFLKIILDRAGEMGVALPALKKALVSGEALPLSLRQQFGERGVNVRQCYATADLGLIAYESEAEQGLILDEELILEIVRPGTGEPVAAGEVGEIVITNFNLEYPLIRFATGDLSAILPGKSPCGRSNVRIKGWMGRADQTTKVKGMFVHPGQINEVAKRFPALGRVRLVVDNPGHQDRMTLYCEAAGADDGLKDGLIAALRELTKLRGEVAFVPAGSLANDGKVIEDLRKYE
ncbi:MAG TPA: AMP-binding protein, partial [Rhodocyclaceae bacterium]|nr:AMP-binding protein [Rhodocyclaceae bacterium]